MIKIHLNWSKLRKLGHYPLKLVKNWLENDQNPLNWLKKSAKLFQNQQKLVKNEENSTVRFNKRLRPGGRKGRSRSRSSKYSDSAACLLFRPRCGYVFQTKEGRHHRNGRNQHCPLLRCCQFSSSSASSASSAHSAYSASSLKSSFSKIPESGISWDITNPLWIIRVNIYFNIQ